MFDEMRVAPVTTNVASSFIITVPAARETFVRLETDRPRDGTIAFKVVYGDVQAIRSRCGDLLREWNALRQQLEIASNFNDPEGFLRGVAGHYGIPCVLFVRSKKTLAIVVGMIENAPFVQRIGYLKIHTPRLRTLQVPETGILCGPDPAALDVVSRTLHELLSSHAIDHLAIHSLPLDHPLSERLALCMKSGCGLVRAPHGRWRTRLLDVATGERLTHHSGKTRYNLRRSSRRLDESFGGRVDLDRIERTEQVDGFVRDATSIIRQTYQAALGVGVKDTPAYRQLLLDLAATGALCGYVLKAGELAIAYLVGDIHDRTFRLWATSFLPQHGALSPGIVLISRVLDDLAARGVALFDFGYGEADYKSMFGSERVEESHWRVYSDSMRGRIALLFDRLISTMNALAHRLLRSHNLLRRIKKLWRARLRARGGDDDVDVSGSGPPRTGP